MKLSGLIHYELEKALIDAFPNKSLLTHMVRHQLDERLSEIAGGNTLREVVFNLVEWAESQDKIDLLLTAARTENPNNQRLATINLQLDHTQIEAEIHESINEMIRMFQSSFTKSAGLYVRAGENNLRIAAATKCIKKFEEFYPRAEQLGSDMLISPLEILSRDLEIIDSYENLSTEFQDKLRERAGERADEERNLAYQKHKQIMDMFAEFVNKLVQEISNVEADTNVDKLLQEIKDREADTNIPIT